jgi:hypothetical protein
MTEENLVDKRNRIINDLIIAAVAWRRDPTSVNGGRLQRLVDDYLKISTVDDLPR